MGVDINSYPWLITAISEVKTGPIFHRLPWQRTRQTTNLNKALYLHLVRWPKIDCDTFEWQFRMRERMLVICGIQKNKLIILSQLHNLYGVSVVELYHRRKSIKKITSVGLGMKTQYKFIRELIMQTLFHAIKTTT